MLIIPIRTESEIRRTPLANYLLLGANVFLFLVLDQVLSGEAISSFKMRYLALHSDEPALYQFFTYQFLHADLWHLFGNMLFLWIFGDNVEDWLGSGRYLLFYLAGGVLAALAHVFTNATSLLPTVGASGAIAAVMGAYLVLHPRAQIQSLIILFFYTAYVGAQFDGAGKILETTFGASLQGVAKGVGTVIQQVLRHRLAQWVTEIESLQQLTYHIVRMKEAGMDVTKEISMGKLLAGQLSSKVTDGCLQMFGGLGFMNEMKISRYFRDSRLIAIGGGANEVMCEIISKMEGF